MGTFNHDWRTRPDSARGPAVPWPLVLLERCGVRRPWELVVFLEDGRELRLGWAAELEPVRRVIAGLVRVGRTGRVGRVGGSS